MNKSSNLTRLRFWLRFTFFMVMVCVGIYFVFDPAVPRLYKLLLALGVMGILLYVFLGGGGGKGGPLGGKPPPIRVP
jgi:hypothetical protein